MTYDVPCTANLGKRLYPRQTPDKGSSCPPFNLLLVQAPFVNVGIPEQAMVTTAPAQAAPSATLPAAPSTSAPPPVAPNPSRGTQAGH